MNIFTIIGFLLIIYILVDFKKAFILFLIFRLLLNPNINLINIPGVPLLTLEFVLCFLFWCIYLVKRNNVNIDKTPFPLKTAFVFNIISLILSSIFGIAGFGNAAFNLIKEILENYISIWLIWVLLKDKKDYIFLIKGITIVFLLTSVYGIFEATTHTNPIMDYITSIAGDNDDKIVNWSYTTEEGRGYRIRSIFIHAIGAGMNWSLFFLIVFYLFTSYNKSIKLKYKYLIIVTVVSIVCLFFTNSRGPLIFSMIGILPLINFKNKKNITLILLGFATFFIVFYQKDEIFTNIYSIFSKSVQEEVGGSNLDMRLEQLDASLRIMKEYPLFGIGLKGLNYYFNQYLVSQLLGLESIWFWVLVQQGIFGVITTLYLIYSLVYKLGIKAKNYYVLFLSLAYFITYSMTSVPGFSLYLLYVFIFMFIKIKKWNTLAPKTI